MLVCCIYALDSDDEDEDEEDDLVSLMMLRLEVEQCRYLNTRNTVHRLAGTLQYTLGLPHN